MALKSVCGVTLRALCLTLGIGYRDLEIEAARFEKEVGPPAKIGQARIFSTEQAERLKELIRQRREVKA